MIVIDYSLMSIYIMNNADLFKVRIKKYKGTLVVESYSLYRFTGLARKNYHRWAKSCVNTLGVEGIDFFNIKEPEIEGEYINKKIRVLFSIDFSEALCLSINTPKSLKLRLELLRIKYDVINGKYEVPDYYTHL